VSGLGISRMMSSCNAGRLSSIAGLRTMDVLHGRGPRMLFHDDDFAFGLLKVTPCSLGFDDSGSCFIWHGDRAGRGLFRWVFQPLKRLR